MISRTWPGPRWTKTLSLEAADGISIDAPVCVRKATRTAANVEFSASMVRRLPSQVTAGGCGGVCSAVGGVGATASGTTDVGTAGVGVDGFTAAAGGLSLRTEFVAGAGVACARAKDDMDRTLVKQRQDRDLPILRGASFAKPLPGTCDTALPFPLRPISENSRADRTSLTNSRPRTIVLSNLSSLKSRPRDIAGLLPASEPSG